MSKESELHSTRSPEPRSRECRPGGDGQIRQFICGTAVIGAVAVGGLVIVPTAGAAPTGPSNIETTVKNLQAQGYNVIVNRIGSAPLSQCTISAVRPGQTFSTVDSRASGSPTTTIISKTVFVDAAC
jgi:hypothetical protein